MAISKTNLTTYDSASPGTTPTTSSVSWSAGDLIVVRVAASQFPGAWPATGVSVGGNAATKCVAFEGGTGLHYDRDHASIWTFAPGSGGSGTVVATFGGTNDSASIVVDRLTSQHASPIGNNDTDFQQNGSGLDPDITVATTVDSLVLAAGSMEDASANLADNGAQTSDFRGTAGSWMRFFSSKTASTTSTSMTWVESTNDRNFSVVALEILAAAGGSSIVPILNTRRFFGG